MKRPSPRLALLGLILIAGCMFPARPPVTGTSGIQPTNAWTLEGRVDWGPRRETQATLTDIAAAATVNIIDPNATSSATVASSLTDSKGAFKLDFAGWKPTTGNYYYLEAMKGLGNNRATFDAVRVRTLLRAETGFFSSLTNARSAPISISGGTTALSIAEDLKRSTSTKIGLSTLIGSLAQNLVNGVTTETFTAVTNLPVSEFTQLANLVNSALYQDLDPLTFIGRDSSSGTYFLSTPFSPYINVLTPNSAAPGALVTIKGLRFPMNASDVTVKFGTLTATVLSTSTTEISVVVPAGVVTSYVQVSTPAGPSNLVPFMALAPVGGKFQGS
jgi:hypothetical protein